MAWFDKLVNLLGLVAGILLVALTVLVCCDVMARYFRLFSMPWSLDFAQYGLFVITFFGAPWVLVNHGHITIDLVVDRLSNERAGFYAEFLTQLEHLCQVRYSCLPAKSCGELIVMALQYPIHLCFQSGGFMRLRQRHSFY